MEVDWSAGARQDMNRLPGKVAAAVVEFVYGPLVVNPQRLGKPLRWALAGRHSARRGDFRVIYTVSPDAIRIDQVTHRADAYRPR